MLICIRSVLIRSKAGVDEAQTVVLSFKIFGMVHPNKSMIVL